MIDATNRQNRRRPHGVALLELELMALGFEWRDGVALPPALAPWATPRTRGPGLLARTGALLAHAWSAAKRARAGQRSARAGVAGGPAESCC